MATTSSIPDNPVFQEDYYASVVTERLAPAALLTRTADALLPARPGVMMVVLVVVIAGAVRLGWLLRELSGMPYTIYHLAWLVPLACLLVAWGNRRAAE